MKLLINNPFLYSNVMYMLHEIYNQSPSETYAGYVLLCELDQVKTIKTLRAKGLKVIFYDLEHTKSEKFKIDGKSYFEYFTQDVIPFVDEFWTYTLENQAFYRSKGFENVKFQPFLYVNILKNNRLLTADSYNERPIDVLFYGRNTEYRQSLFSKIQDIGCTFVTAHAVTGAKLEWLLGNSKIILDTRQCDEYYNQNVVRLFYPVINNQCVLSQHSNDDHYMGDSIEYFTDETDLKQKIVELLMNDKWREVAKNAGEKYRALCNSGDKWHTSDIELK